VSRATINEPSSTGIALRSSTGWYAVVDEDGETVTNRLFGSCFRAAEWACDKYGRTWPQLHAMGFTVRGGFEAETEVEALERKKKEHSALEETPATNKGEG